MPFPTSELSADNVLRDVHDQVSQSLRTTAEVSFPPSLEIEISAADGDNIAISDGTNDLVVNPDGSINVQTAGASAESVRVDEPSASISYFGFAAPGTADSAATWKILRMTVTGTVQSYQYANGAADYTNVWDDRASLSYS